MARDLNDRIADSLFGKNQPLFVESVPDPDEEDEDADDEYDDEEDEEDADDWD